jgi:hypothetical protein
MPSPRKAQIEQSVRDELERNQQQMKAAIADSNSRFVSRSNRDKYWVFHTMTKGHSIR